jgi:hypothetical protein
MSTGVNRNFQAVKTNHPGIAVLLLTGKLMQNFTQIPPNMSINAFSPAFRYPNYM